jgi:hypothetical protein
MDLNRQGGPDRATPRHSDRLREFFGSSSLSVEAFKAAARERALAPDFPTANCINPSEVADFSSTGELPGELREHIHGCEYCTALTESLVPDPLACRSFLSEIAVARAQLGEKSRAGSSAVYSPHMPAFGARGHVSVFSRYSIPALATAAGAIVLVFGVVYRQGQRPALKAGMANHVSHSEPISTAGFGDVILTLDRREELQPKNEAPLVLKVGLSDEKIKPSYYPRVAAGVTTLSLDSMRTAALSPPQEELRQKYTEALAQVTTAKQFEDASAASRADHTTCLSISSAASDKGLTVLTEKNPSICLIKLGSASLRVNPTQNVDSTLYYISVLRSAKGDAKALNDAAEKVNVELKPGAGSTSLSADRMDAAPSNLRPEVIHKPDP